MENDIVTEAVELLKGENNAYEPPVTGTPGEHTLKNFLATALEPVGTTLYIYGGGWNWQDNGSSIQATTIGISPDWVRFFIEQDEDFTYRAKDGGFYPYGGFNEYYYAGLDCSGYLGWVVYNTLNDKSGGEGYVGTYFEKQGDTAGRFTWDVMGEESVLTDPEGFQKLSPEEVLSELFAE